MILSARLWILLGLFLVVLPSSAQAEFGISPDPLDPTKPDFHVRLVSDDATTVYRQAGGHPFALVTDFAFNRMPSGVAPDENVRTIKVDLPVGLVGSPTATPKCSFDRLAKGVRDSIPCPAETQVGTLGLVVGLSGVVIPLGEVPVFNMTPAAGDVATFAFLAQSVVTAVHIRIRSESDNGVVATVPFVNSLLPVLRSSLTLWGVPTDPAHDAQRGDCVFIGGTCPAGVQARPFLTAPSDCGAAAGTTTLSVESWQHPGDWREYTTTAPGVTGCELLEFSPTLMMRPMSKRAGAPSGYVIDLDIPQNEEPSGLATPPLRKAAVTLPEGLALSPSAASGLEACSDGQFASKSREPSSCPSGSKIGTVTVETPALEDPLNGSVFVGQPIPGQMYRIFMEVAGSNVRVKLAGDVDLNRATGRITTTFDELPQLPFEHLQMVLKGGEHAVLANPRTCGPHTTTGRFTPWGAPTTPVAETSFSFEISTDGSSTLCVSPRPFDPKLQAGSTNPVAGTHSSFLLALQREDAEEEIASLSVTPPEGLLAKLKNVPYCPEEVLRADYVSTLSGALEMASPGCPSASRIGSAIVGAGAGSNPFYAQTGKVYLAGPYKGAPLSLATIVPALAGPFDLGTVMVRSAIHVNPESARISVISDPLPRILEGVPVGLRDIRVAIDRPDFMLNPTSCEQGSVTALVRGAEGAIAEPKSRFQMLECGSLPFEPRLGLRLKGGNKRGEFPALRATLRMPKSRGANIAKAQVTLPRSEFLAQSHIRTICTRVQFAADNCPKGSIYGHAIATTPLLDQPLSGPVYLRSSSNPLPDLVAHLAGQIEVDLVGRIDSTKDGGIRTTFAQVPDAPVSKFTLTMQGGKKGLLENSRNLCASTNRASALFDAQNGKVKDLAPVVRAAGCGEGRKRHSAHSG